jgi:hypothetical protein
MAERQKAQIKYLRIKMKMHKIDMLTAIQRYAEQFALMYLLIKNN